MIQNEQMSEIIAAAGLEGAREIMAAFWRSTDDLVSALDPALETGAFDEAAGLAHAIKGSASNVGAAALAQEAMALEAACKCEDRAAAASSLVAIKACVAETLTAFDTFFNTLAA